MKGHGYTVGARGKYRQIVDKNDNYLCNKWQEDVDFSKDIYRVSLLWLKNSKGQVLIAQRAPHKENHGGLWGPAVAGTVEYDESYRDNIAKEAREEIGLVGLEFYEGPKLFFSSERKHFTQIFYASCDKLAEEFELESEVAAVKWVDFEWLCRDVAEHGSGYVPSLPTILEQLH